MELYYPNSATTGHAVVATSVADSGLCWDKFHIEQSLESATEVATTGMPCKNKNNIISPLLAVVATSVADSRLCSDKFYIEKKRVYCSCNFSCRLWALLG